MAMLINLPMLPRDIVGHIRACPEMLAFMVRYGERIPARVLHISFCRPSFRIVERNDRSHGMQFDWGVGLHRRHTRFLWNLPRCAFRYLTRGMPVIIRLSENDMTLYTFIEMRHSSLLIGVGPCEIEMPTDLIVDIALYVDVPDALTHFVRSCYQPGVTAANEEAFDLARAERDAESREQSIRSHSLCGCNDGDDVTHARNARTIRMFLMGIAPENDCI